MVENMTPVKLKVRSDVFHAQLASSIQKILINYTLMNNFHISYQNSKIGCQKMGTISVKSALNALKIEVFKKWQ